jgi:RimJ/RimL family protein N-acetyltransferase
LRYAGLIALRLRIEDEMRSREVYPQSLLTTERLVLRRWRGSDLEPFRRMNADPRVMEFMSKLLDSVESDALVERIERHFDERGFGLMAVELKESGEFIGFVGLSVPQFEAPFMPAVEIGWRLAAEYWGKGFATEAARETVRFAFEKVGLESVVSFTVPANGRSRRVIKKIGMRLAGEFEHPGIAEGHKLRHHVIYRVEAMSGEARGLPGPARTLSQGR